MISFKNKAETGTSIAILAAIVVLVGTGIVMILPQSDEKVANKARFTSRDSIQADIDKLKGSIKELQTKVDAKLWTLPLTQIGPKALETVTGFAQKSKLKLVAFRPQKANEVNGLTQLPFLISLEGGYPGVMQFLRSLETGDAKLATNLVQFSSTDGNSDLVTATIGVAAYTKVKPLKPAQPQTKENVNAKEAN